MYATGDFIASNQQFNSDSWGPTTAQYMDHIINDLSENHWTSIFSAMHSFSAQTVKEEATYNGIPTEQYERVTLPPSDPLSPARDD